MGKITEELSNNKSLYPAKLKFFIFNIQIKLKIINYFKNDYN